ncbi:MAG: D-alanyl-D-alanine carboxypeptidase [Sulfobacillus acidophilus]|uniref:D-alanyl-D-alanine carboxypeptidase n=1 Tax=Sulfobacillus acidophilus TaxID=53633 RepID=A0A2T2WEF3_9FIRM|nr:MAG: D-alanyl-D-alanine carboxypeptidase [Sulfobacillus acidophilus]
MSLRTSSIIAIVVSVLIALGIVQLARPVARPTVAVGVPSTTHMAGSLPKLPWPSGAQADVEVPGIGQWRQHGPSGARPIGSLAKMMTAYLVLKAHPLSAYGNGPTLTMTAQDATVYRADAATQQSVMPVTVGEKLSERMLLEGLLIPSGNNIATLLAQWVAGTVPRFTSAMNAEAKALGLTQTHYHGPVGLSPSTVSTAANEMKLAIFMMKLPIFRTLVAMPQMTMPGNATPKIVYNYNYLLGHNGVIGVKTGSTTYSGGCVVLAKNKTVDGRTLTVYASVLGQQATRTTSQLWASLDAANALLRATTKIVGTHRVITAGEVAGSLRAPWQSPIPLVTTKSASLIGWSGLTYSLHLTTRIPNATTIPAGTIVGSLSARVGSQTVTVPVKTAASLQPPSWLYRLKR